MHYYYNCSFIASLFLATLGLAGYRVGPVHVFTRRLYNAILCDVEQRFVDRGMATIENGTSTASSWKVASRRSGSRCLVHRPQILIQPVQAFLDQFVARDVVAGFVEQVFLLIFL